MAATWTPRGSHAGNRWWVAYNMSQKLGSSELSGFASNPLGTGAPSGYEAVGSGDAADDAIFAKAAAATAAAGPVAAGTGPTVSVQNETWANVSGPYPSYAAAEAAIGGIQAAEPAPGNGSQAASLPGLAAPGLAAIGAFFSSLGAAATWIRVAKVAIGGTLVIVGVAKMTGAGKVIEGVVKP